MTHEPQSTKYILYFYLHDTLSQVDSSQNLVFLMFRINKFLLLWSLNAVFQSFKQVKQSMKENKDKKTLQRVLDARQLGLKLIANVTYGYTAANFSGRMPCIEVTQTY